METMERKKPRPRRSFTPGFKADVERSEPATARSARRPGSATERILAARSATSAIGGDVVAVQGGSDAFLPNWARAIHVFDIPAVLPLQVVVGHDLGHHRPVPERPGPLVAYVRPKVAGVSGSRRAARTGA